MPGMQGNPVTRPREIGPRDFDAYRAEITGCYCAAHCLPMSAAPAVPRPHLARALLAALQSGSHVRRTWPEHIADAKRKAAGR